MVCKSAVGVGGPTAGNNKPLLQIEATIPRNKKIKSHSQKLEIIGLTCFDKVYIVTIQNLTFHFLTKLTTAAFSL